MYSGKDKCMTKQNPTVIDFLVYLGKKLVALDQAGIPYQKGELSEIRQFDKLKPLDNFLGELAYARGGQITEKDYWLVYLVMYCEQGAVLEFVIKKIDQAHPLGKELYDFLRPRVDLMLQTYDEVQPIIWRIQHNRRKDSQLRLVIQLGWLDRWKLKQAYQKMNKAVPSPQEIQSMGELSDVLVQLFDLPGSK